MLKRHLASLPNLHEDSGVFQHGNEQEQTAGYTKQWLSYENLEALDWNMWGLMTNSRKHDLYILRV